MYCDSDENTEKRVYALKHIFNAHAGDVRVLKATSYPEGGILTGSRDACVKLWAPNEESFRECIAFGGMHAFITSLCVLPPSIQYPKGLFLAGSQDCSIYGFTPEKSFPVIRLMGHSGTVCSLSYGDSGIFVSGSWDKTARVWNGQKCVLTLSGHQEAVWATDMFKTQNLVLTGSADRTIRLWRQDKCEREFIGHQDCVRGLAILDDTQFLSCSNDSTVRLWQIGGDCLKIFAGHSDYIYSISLLNNGKDFVTCGEDQNIKIWRNGALIQTFVLASKSLWNVACLSNGDLAVGTSDGKVYVFEKVGKSYFEVKTLKQQTSILNSTSGDSALVSRDLYSSIYCGEKIVTYLNPSDYMYVCEFDNVAGTKIKKEVLDYQMIDNMFYKKFTQGSAATDVQSQVMTESDYQMLDNMFYKKFIQGSAATDVLSKPTDYSFDVDVGHATYKIAFNKGEKPFDVAKKFVSDYNLPMEHIPEIENYIIKNVMPSATESTFSNTFYPVKTFLSYYNCNYSGLRAKLSDFCTNTSGEQVVSCQEIDDIMILVRTFPPVVQVEQISTLERIVQWSDEYLFPVLDFLRVGVEGKGLRSKVANRDFMNHLLHIYLTTKRKINRVLIQKILCNLFLDDETEKVLAAYQDKILECVKEQVCTGEISIQKSAASLFLNFAVASFKGFELNLDRYCSTTMDIFNQLDDSEAIYRMLIAVGTLCTRSTLALTYFRSVDFKLFILKFRNYDEKVVKVVDLLYADF